MAGRDDVDGLVDRVVTESRTRMLLIVAFGLAMVVILAVFFSPEGDDWTDRRIRVGIPLLAVLTALFLVRTLLPSRLELTARGVTKVRSGRRRTYEWARCSEFRAEPQRGFRVPAAVVFAYDDPNRGPTNPGIGGFWRDTSGEDLVDLLNAYRTAALDGPAPGSGP